MTRQGVSALLGLWVWTLALPVVAHPLGNISVNRQAAITVGAKRVEIRYRLDVAEIPTLAAAYEADTDQDGETAVKEWHVYTQRWARDTLPQLALRLNGQSLDLRLNGTRESLAPGAAGLRVLRLEARYAARLPPGVARGELDYQDTTQLPHVAWSEVFIAPESGVEARRSDVPAHDRSRGLTVYPTGSGAVLPKENSARADLVWLPPPARAPQAQAASGAESNAPPPAMMPAAPEHTDWRRYVWPFFRLGMHHIATGWDHLAFLLGLLLLSASWSRLAKIVTAFTVAHSLTLASAALGWVALPGVVIEPAIALTVAYVGLAALLRRDNGGALLAFGFGLVHGFGFAGALADTLARAPRAEGAWLAALASFNAGIESVQLLLVALAAPLLVWLQRRGWEKWPRRLAATTVLGGGLAWFFARVAWR